MDYTKKLTELKSLLYEVSDLNNAAAVLGWDQATYMPAGGAPARGRQMATLAQVAQEKFIDKKVGKLLDQLAKYEESLPFDSDDASYIRVARREYERAIKVPPEFIGELNVHSAETYQMWTEARPANDFARVRPNLERTLDLSRKLADFFPGYEHIADPLIDFADYGVRCLRSCAASWCPSSRPSHPKRPRTIPACESTIPKPSNSNLAHRSSSSWATISSAAAWTRPIIPS
jgi:carboxypeptidase Taq